MTEASESYFLKDYAAGEVLFRQGDVGSRVYAVQSGEVEVRREIKGEEFLLNIVGAGDFLGEMAIVNGRPRSASAVMRTDVTLLVMEGSFFMELFHNDPEIASRVARTMSQRLDHSNRWVETFMFEKPDERMVHSLSLLVEEQIAERQHRGAVYVPMTMRELAERAHVSREQAIDVVERLADDGLITSASAVDIDGPGYVVAEAELLLNYLGVSAHGTEHHFAGNV